MYPHLTTLKRHFARLLHGWALAPAPASAHAEVRISWRLIHAELGLAAWVAETGPQRTTCSPAASAVLVLTDPDDSESPRELARQLAAAHPGHPVVLPLWQAEQLQQAGLPPEVALQLLLQRLRDDGLVGSAPPTLLSSDKTRALARCFTQRYDAHMQSLPRTAGHSLLQRNGASARRWLPA